MDAETGLYYHGARYRDAKTGVWLSCDPILERYFPDDLHDEESELPSGGIYNPININLYHYAANNPIMMHDPDGKASRDNPFNVGRTVPRNAGRGTTYKPKTGSEIYKANGIKYVEGKGNGRVPSLSEMKLSSTRVTQIKNIMKSIEYSSTKSIENGKKYMNITVKGEVSVAEADYLGKKWVGEGYTTKVSDGKVMYESADGLRIYRAPSEKGTVHSKTGFQANFESRPTNSGEYVKNVHVDVYVPPVSGGFGTKFMYPSISD